jgi:hypothetical protein
MKNIPEKAVYVERQPIWRVTSGRGMFYFSSEQPRKPKEILDFFDAGEEAGVFLE